VGLAEDMSGMDGWMDGWFEDSIFDY
jgi:hypothetical protein